MLSQRRLAVVFTACLIALVGTSCAKKSKSDESNVPSTETALSNDLGSSDEGKAMGLQTVHFAFDSFSLDSASKSIVKENADILKKNSSVKIQVEGHTDARGGVQYNIALGEKRANAVRSMLTDLGVGGDRITTVSFGKERPIEQGDSESAYSKNRRANFVITSR